MLKNEKAAPKHKEQLCIFFKKTLKLFLSLEHNSKPQNYSTSLPRLPGIFSNQSQVSILEEVVERNRPVHENFLNHI